MPSSHTLHWYVPAVFAIIKFILHRAAVTTQAHAIAIRCGGVRERTWKMQTRTAEGIWPPHITPTNTSSKAIVLSVRTTKLLGIFLSLDIVSDMLLLRSQTNQHRPRALLNCHLYESRTGMASYPS